MAEPTADTNAEDMFDQALAIADKHLDAALDEAGPLADYVAVAMVEAAVNAAVDAAGHEDIAKVLRELADQIEKDAEEGED
jgi:dihydroxyacetone kinase DhaKLM complex PTS-EIIA-like component DhaM